MASGFYDFVAGAKPLATEWDDYISKQVVMTFATTSARDTALSGHVREGMYADAQDTDRLMRYNGSAWVPSSGRWGTTVTRSGQSVANGVLGTISFDTETQDTDGYITVTSTTVTIPSNLGGIYGVTGTVVRASGSFGTTTGSFLRIVAGGTTYDFAPTGTDRITGTLSIPLAATNTVTLAINNGDATVNMTGVLHVMWLAP